MSLKVAFLLMAAAALGGAALGYTFRVLISLGKKGSMELRLKEIESEAAEKAKKIIADAETKAIETIQEIRLEIKEKEEKLKKTEDRIVKKEDQLEKRQQDLDSEITSAKEKIAEIREIKEKVLAQEAQKKTELEKIARLTADEARAELFSTIEKNYAEDLIVRMQKLENAGEDAMEKRAKEILTTTIHRLGNSVSADVFSTTITIPSDDLKGKIIGKE